MSDTDVTLPIYLITGFLDSGKTTFLNFTISQDYFRIEQTTLLVLTEEGEEEYDPGILAENNTVCEVIGSFADLTAANLKKLVKKHNAKRVIIEFNPLWGVSAMEQMKLPSGWGIIQEIVTVDASTFRVYMNNMKSLFVEMTRNADMVMFNRCNKELPLANFRRSIKVVNPGCEVLFENTEGEITDIFEDSVPYDLNADIVAIDDIDFGIFFVDARDNPKKYDHKTVRFKGQVLKSKNDGAEYFVPGRMAMTCCAEDVTFIGYVCNTEMAPQLKEGDWVEVTAEIKYQMMKLYGGVGPVLYAKEIKEAEAPKSELVYFT